MRTWVGGQGAPSSIPEWEELFGHLPPIEQPDAYARLVSDFLGGSTPA